MFMGTDAGFTNTTGGYNVYIGESAFSSVSAGNHNVAIGASATSSSSSVENSVAIGYNAFAPANYTARIGNSLMTSIGGYADWTNVSDKRLKKDIQENVPGLNFIMKLKPVTYHLDMDAIAKMNGTPDSLRSRNAEMSKGNILETGFLAQDVEKAANEIGFNFSGVDKPKNDKDIYGLRYATFVVPLVKAVQEQQQTIEQLKQEIDLLKEQNKKIELLEAEIQSLKK